MQNPTHPDDERLAALAASEADALADSPLVTHVARCPRCAPMVQDLRTLHSALAELPDIQPSRPLRFLPAAPDPASRRPRWLGVLRGITAPAMAMAVLLIVVGAFGTAFNNGIGFVGAGGAAPAAASQNIADARSSSSIPAPSTSESGKGGQPLSPGSSHSPVPAVAGSSAHAFAAASASAGDHQRSEFALRLFGGAQSEPARPPFGLMLGAGVVLLAAAFVARGYVRRRSLA